MVVKSTSSCTGWEGRTPVHFMCLQDHLMLRRVMSGGERCVYKCKMLHDAFINVSVYVFINHQNDVLASGAGAPPCL